MGPAAGIEIDKLWKEYAAAYDAQGEAAKRGFLPTYRSSADRNAYMVGKYPVNVVQAAAALSAPLWTTPNARRSHAPHIGGDNPPVGAVQFYSDLAFNRNAPLKVALLGSGPAPELLAIVDALVTLSEIAYLRGNLEPRTLDVSCFDLIDNEWAPQFDISKDLATYFAADFVHGRAPLNLAVRHGTLDLSRPLQEDSLRQLTDRHLVIIQNVIDELRIPTSALSHHLVTIARSLTPNASLVLSDFLEHDAPKRTFASVTKELAEDDRLTVETISSLREPTRRGWKSLVRSPFVGGKSSDRHQTIPREIQDRFFGYFSNGACTAKVNIPFGICKIREKQARPVPLLRGY